MPLQRGLENHFQFCVLEVSKQIEDTIRVLQEPSAKLIEQIASRDDYIDHLKSLIEKICFETLVGGAESAERVDLIRAILAIASNLEHIADCCQSIVSQVRYLSHVRELARYKVLESFEAARKCVDEVFEATLQRDVKAALRICRCEYQLDRFYASSFQGVSEHLKEQGGEQDALTSLMICNYLERIGDALLNIGEAVIFSAMGEKLKIHQYEALEESLGAINVNTPIQDLRIESYWGTRSGCRISRVQEDTGPTGSRWVLFKEGKMPKIRQEKQNIERWEALLPGLPPKVYEYHEHGTQASILLEYLGGNTLQRIVLQPELGLEKRSFAALKSTLKQIWASTFNSQPIRSEFLSQIRSRLRDVYQVHPEFLRGTQAIGKFRMRDFEELLKEAAELEEKLQAPFQVLIHGDFNTDNLIFDDQENSIHYIDVHRSREGDYVQDVTVFMVSNFRVPSFDAKIRARLEWAALEMLRLGRAFAAQHGDHSFELRATLGLVRSFVTSTRFELHPKFSRTMFLRAKYLLEKVLREKEHLESFRLPEEVMHYH